ncbi:methyltransferase domain-containing protein [Euzebyella marina]|uniref:Methyltransferase domain-containing protein n=1 Tax=Euzebyella marina TaxID=1761453 RepID=A0A3G2L9L1_9FLAO|nr:class I SAM-dependent methyltransferase [Euzebyella marina]AYN68958.1 methyltransferase domain-containing protein [Euzebyella marina]
MNDPWQKKWNERYSQKAYAFGTEPNVFLKEQLDELNPGSILFAAEGEGRNAIYAATNAWESHAFDISEEGQKKAFHLAKSHDVSLDYRLGQLPDLGYKENSFDAVGLIYAHFPAEIKSEYHQIIGNLVKKGGHIILEAFGKNHLPYREANPKVGGPRNLESLFSIEEIRSDFHDFEAIILEETEIELSEGAYHNGKGSVIRFVGRKR